MGLAPGAKVDRYVVEGLLGSGGMAEVYAVRHAALGSKAALKVLTVRSPVLARRLEREGRAQALLAHPNVVRVLDLVEVDGAPGLVMERVEGPTLAQVLEAGALSWDRAERIARGILLGLAEAHRRGIVHRDLKPSNVLLAAGEVPRIADFGLATALVDESAAGLTRPGAALGTPTYMAPEQHEDASRVDARADLFALGVVLYEMLTGRAPAAGQNPIAAWHTMTRKAWRDPRDAVPALPQRLAEATRWALEPDREARPPTAEALWERLTGQPFPRGDGALPAVPAAPGERRAAGALPKPARPLAGRSEELLAALAPLEARGSVVTLVGTGGVGKTRLALEVAGRWEQGRRDVLWVDLQPARHVDDLVQAVGWTLDDAGDGSVAAVGRALSRRGALLLVLDNLEQLPRAIGAVVTEWTRLAPSLRVLATSRQALGVPDERPVELHPLPLPDRPEDALGSPAWTVLAAAAPRGALDAVSPERAHALLLALEGLPLALELAGARLEVLALDDFERKLGDRFELLSNPDASGERHGALYEAIAWSWSLLTDGERATLAQAAVFAGPFSLAAAEAVLEPGTGTVLDALHGLVRRSLVRHRAGRYAMLASIREFADLKLEPEARAEATRRHAVWHAERARERFGSGLGSEAALTAVEELAPELDAVVRNAAHGHVPAEHVLLAAAAVAELGTTRGPRESAVRVVTDALSLVPETDGTRKGLCRLLVSRALALRWGGRYDEAARDLAHAAELGHDGATAAVVAAHRGDLAAERGDLAEAERAYRLALAIAERTGPAHLVATSCVHLATVLVDRGQGAEADMLVRRGVASIPAGDLRTELLVRRTEGWYHLRRDDLALAAEALDHAFEIARSLDDQRSMATVSGRLGLVAECRGDLAGAEAAFQSAAARMAEQGDPLYVAYWEGYRGRVLLRRRQWTEGRRVLGAALISLPPHAPRGMRALLEDALALGQARAGDALAGVTVEPPRDRLPAALAAGFRGISSGDRAAAAGALAVAEELLPGTVELATGLLAEVVLGDLRDELGAWRISADGLVVTVPGGSTVDLARHAANARILAHLVRARLAEPGATSDTASLAEAGWPGERIVPTAAGNRVRVALSALRRAGLGDLIERVEGGWRVPPALPVRISP